ncbi:MAG: DUF3108 domain-containing protein [Candidatus Cloacimonetes bacterium]|nr:DUF3108 domain-containing protein [Candidatus Cloacimonadota bacterium]MCF7813474.1 DUF3108 domain-containing protein [Candidatus Cloacimonadota bacterium]MCF7869176.1 DUF3108 domain-containing protein [Candidatus Cloacimonadota bacterium]MCF7883390.1 DUF3108 domain-containing protein [Candidatus Cloacimonadota bacterium]
MRKLILILLTIFSVSLLAFQPGEKLTFEIKYGVISAGEATLQIEDHTYRDSIETYRITSLANTNSFFDHVYKVRDRLESIWRKRGLVTLRFTKKLREGSYRQHRIHFYYPDQNFTIYTKIKKKKTSQERMEIADKTQDIFSAFYYYRLQDFSVGDTLVINVTADGRNYPAKIVAHRLETIETIFGDKECIVVEPILEGEAIFKQTGEIYIWLTYDEHKIPVLMSSKIIFGHFKAILKDAENVPFKITEK